MIFRMIYFRQMDVSGQILTRNGGIISPFSFLENKRIISNLILQNVKNLSLISQFNFWFNILNFNIVYLKSVQLCQIICQTALFVKTFVNLLKYNCSLLFDLRYNCAQSTSETFFDMTFDIKRGSRYAAYAAKAL